MKRLPYLVVALVALVGIVWYVGALSSDGELFLVPVPPKYASGQGHEFATKLAGACQKVSFSLLVTGWFFVCGSALLAIGAAVLGSSPLPKDSASIVEVLKSQRGLLCSAFALIFGGLGWQCLDRSSAASYMASVANRAIKTASGPESNADRLAYDACVDAKSAWLEGRMNHERLLRLEEGLREPILNGDGSLDSSETFVPESTGEGASQPPAGETVEDR